MRWFRGSAALDFLAEHHLYSDIDPGARQIAAHRIEQMHRRFLDTFPRAASRSTFTALPQNIKDVTMNHLRLAAPSVSQWLVVAGWECQDLSIAGAGRGLHGWRQELHLFRSFTAGGHPSTDARRHSIVSENVVTQCSPDPTVRERDHSIICQA